MAGACLCHLHVRPPPVIPKGVEVTRQNLDTFLSGVAHDIGTGPGEAWLAMTTISFDIAMLEIFLPLRQGARVYIARRNDSRNGVRLLSIVRRRMITALQSTPSGWRLLLEAGWSGQDLKLALSGGEPMDPDLAASLRARSATVFNLYGPTEATVWATAHRVTDGAGPVPVGHPLQGVTARIYDRFGNICPDGLSGELCLGGAHVASGYSNRAAETAQRFVPDPCGPRGARMFRTGDTAYRRADGALVVLGRRDLPDQAARSPHRTGRGRGSLATRRPRRGSRRCSGHTDRPIRSACRLRNRRRPGNRSDPGLAGVHATRPHRRA